MTRALIGSDTELGVPSLVKAPAARPRCRARRGSGCAKTGSSLPGHPGNTQAKKTAPASMPARTALEKLTVELPGYLIDALKREALDRHSTARHVLMLALQKAGFAVDGADLVPDARRGRKTGNP